jgi:hypothetical protein
MESLISLISRTDDRLESTSSPVSTEKVHYMKSIDDGIQVHYSLAGNRPELLKDTIQAPKAGKYELTANVVTVAINGASFCG